MPSAQFETCLFVEDYLDDEDPDREEAFDACRGDLDGARDSARSDIVAHISEADAERVIFTSVAFVEFDSSNISHAAGWFEVHIEAPQEVLDVMTGEDKLLPPEEGD